MTKSTTPHFLPLFLCFASPFFLLSLSQTPPAPKHEISTMCSPRKTADQEGTGGTLFPPSSLLSCAQLYSFSKHIPIVLGCAMCSCFLSPDHSSYSPEYLGLAGGQQQRPNKTFCPQRDTSSSEFRGLLVLFIRCKSGPPGQSGELHLERAVSQ